MGLLSTQRGQVAAETFQFGALVQAELPALGGRAGFTADGRHGHLQARWGYDIRLSRCSPTRMALAMAVRAGFTAPMLGKKLVSTT